METKKKLDKRSCFGKVKKLIANGQITMHIVSDKSQITMTYKALKELNPDAYIKKDEDGQWLIFYDGVKLIGYQVKQ